jgi:hypothetical protein
MTGVKGVRDVGWESWLGQAHGYREAAAEQIPRLRPRLLQDNDFLCATARDGRSLGWQSGRTPCIGMAKDTLSGPFDFAPVTDYRNTVWRRFAQGDRLEKYRQTSGHSRGRLHPATRKTRASGTPCCAPHFKKKAWGALHPGLCYASLPVRT